jgi:hypothetical protein
VAEVTEQEARVVITAYRSSWEDVRVALAEIVERHTADLRADRDEWEAVAKIERRRTAEAEHVNDQLRQRLADIRALAAVLDSAS